MLKSLFAKLFAFLGFMGLMASQAQAALVVAPLDTADFMTVAGAVVVALGAFYGVRKALGLLR
ncbi:hypothetical protein [Sulfurimonas sp.]|uniref:hypothetical protein n=1 Tax=Sulfurimonas sp. TaxID=2022749 RepID=UPI001A0B51DA|nr:hypothetical protein [Sulfurimonas sp.]MBE0515515.1 hypothetical protein [Sulfurimonas sp.]